MFVWLRVRHVVHIKLQGQSKDHIATKNLGIAYHKVGVGCSMQSIPKRNERRSKEPASTFGYRHRTGVTNLFAIAGHFVSYRWVIGPSNCLVILWNLLVQYCWFAWMRKFKMLVSPECFAGRTKLFCGPHVRHPCHRETLDTAVQWEKNGNLQVASDRWSQWKKSWTKMRIIEQKHIDNF